MLPCLIPCGRFAFGAAGQPGPAAGLRVLARHRLRLAADRARSAVSLTSDGPTIVLVVLVLTRLPARFEAGVRWGGGILLIYLDPNPYLGWSLVLLPLPLTGGAERHRSASPS